MTQNVIDVKLGLGLGRKFGKLHKLCVKTVPEAMRALSVNIPEFKEFMRSHVGQNTRFAVFVDGKNVNEHKINDLETVREIRIMPIPQGRKSGGLFQTILGGVLLVASYFFPVLLPVAVGLLAGGVAQLLAPQATGLNDQASQTSNRASYAFGSAVNTIAAGNPVCLPYGYRTVGGAVFSAGSYSEDIS
ncbi:tail assembly protein [Escherichia phage bV_EcoS_AHP24]|uniref:Tail assembly protein n=4 Tax=Rogunavirus TaxID=1920866 RepID=A0A067YW46_9CAUD|nr:tail protein [Escherichia phage vB_EcoS_AHS24]AHI60491.1 tail assembly protein [Escherichia phage bV_EcoS_AHP24]AHI60646.1 tail assembly protein [Escherichia phage vB_EcoS_AHS24]QQM15532.1 tail assembly protein [Escherichia phage vB_EcoS-BECP10]